MLGLPLLAAVLIVAADGAGSFQVVADVADVAPEKQLHGRFIHITDIHPDPYFFPGSPIAESCHDHPANGGDGDDDGGGGGGHQKQKKKKHWHRKGLATEFGVGPSECDSPLSLMNVTFDFLEREWADKVDFVIWTGDNARHDIDRAYPRTPQEIYKLNRMVSDRMYDVFRSRGVAVVPSLGNNDIWPHNILYPGPNGITNEFLDIWHKWIPSEQQHVFQRGAYFTSEVVSNKLAVISLNTLYWYDSNKAVDGCGFDSQEPGALEMDWLDVQLEMYRARGMQVWLSGHVPPSPGNYFPDCWYRYGEISLRYQDTIVGATFGHMNVDHFFFINSAALAKYKQTEDTPHTSFTNFTHDFEATDINMGILKSRTRSGTLQGDLLHDYHALPKGEKIDYDDYTLINVSPSIVPTYYPGVRIFTYNVTGETYRPDPNDSEELKKKKKKKGPKKGHAPGDKWCRRHKNRNKPICQPEIPRHADEGSPSRTNGWGTPLGYAQFYMPDVNSRSRPTFELEYVTYPLNILLPNLNATDVEEKESRSPVPAHLLPPSLIEEPESAAAMYAPYELADLTIPSYVGLARRLVDDKKLWKRFLAAIYVGSGAELEE